ncbi:hypothetical protein D3C73_335050 [compost metagenome]
MDKFEKFASKPHLKGPKQQHYVPRFYLEGFTSDQALSVFDRVKGEIRHRQKPQNLATVGHLYTFEDNQDRKRFDFEALFCLVEDAAAPILNSLVQGESLSPKDRESFALFLGLAAVRTPAAIADAKAAHAGLVKAQTLHRYGNENEVFEILKKKVGSGEDEASLRDQARKVAEMVRSDSYDVEVNSQFALHRSLNVWHIVAEELFKRDWRILHVPGDELSFLTSDSPIVVQSRSSSLRHEPIGYGSPHAQILFPLTSKCALVASGSLGRTGRSIITVEDLHRFNLTIAQDCHRYVMAGDADLVERITSELNLAGTSWEPKSSVLVEYQVEADGKVSARGILKRKGC